MASIEDIDAELAHGSSTLLPPPPGEQPPEGQPMEEQPPEEVQEAPPLPLLDHAQYGGRILLGCSLFGCNHVVQGKEERYCSPNHQNLAQILSSQDQDQAYVIVDGFFGKDSRERCFQMVLALLKKEEHNLALGIPEVKDDTIFHSHPREVNFIHSAFLPEETDRAWLFFHTKSNPDFKTFSIEGQGIRWSRSRRFVHKYCEFEGITSTVCYLRLHFTKKSDVRVVEGDPYGLKGWALTEYFYKGRSLYCLSFSSEKNSIIFSTVAVKESTQKRVRSDPGESSRKKKKKTSSSAQPSLVSEEDPVKILLLSKKRELAAIYLKAHIHVSEEVANLIDPSADVSDFDSIQLAESISTLEHLLEEAKLEAANRETIILAVDELILAKKEEEWFSEYNKRGNLFNLLSGNETTIQRATEARTLVSQIPSMILSLTDIVESWETEWETSFLYDKHLLLDLLNEEKQKL